MSFLGKSLAGAPQTRTVDCFKNWLFQDSKMAKIAKASGNKSLCPQGRLTVLPWTLNCLVLKC